LHGRQYIFLLRAQISKIEFLNVDYHMMSSAQVFDQLIAEKLEQIAAKHTVARTRELQELALEHSEREHAAHVTIDDEARRRKRLATRNLNSSYSLKRKRVMTRYKQAIEDEQAPVVQVARDVKIPRDGTDVTTVVASHISFIPRYAQVRDGHE
jgi:hypothetical protein